MRRDTHREIQPEQVPNLIKDKHMNADGFWRQSLSVSRSNWEILIKSKLWARLESSPLLLMRACCLWNVSLPKHISMQMRQCFNNNFINVLHIFSRSRHDDGKMSIASCYNTYCWSTLVHARWHYIRALFRSMPLTFNLHVDGRDSLDSISACDEK